MAMKRQLKYKGVLAVAIELVSDYGYPVGGKWFRKVINFPYL